MGNAQGKQNVNDNSDQKEINKYLRHSNEVMLIGIYKLK